MSDIDNFRYPNKKVNIIENDSDQRDILIYSTFQNNLNEQQNSTLDLTIDNQTQTNKESQDQIEQQQQQQQILQEIEQQQQQEKEIQQQQEQQQEQQVNANKQDIVKIVQQCQSIFNPQQQKNEKVTQISLDCEMVKCKMYNNKLKHQVCRVSIVDQNGFVLIDQLIKPPYIIVDSLQKITGLKINDLIDQPSLQDIKPKIQDIIQDKLIIGHSIKNDLELLGFPSLIDFSFDISKVPLFYDNSNQKQSLKFLTKAYIDVEIQTKHHSSVQDARAAMALFQYCLLTNQINK